MKHFCRGSNPMNTDNALCFDLFYPRLSVLIRGKNAFGVSP